MDVNFVLMFSLFVYNLSVVFSKLELRLLKHHTALEGYALLTLQGISLQECWGNCENRPRCSSINYRRLMHHCQLNHGFYGDESVFTATVQKAGSVFYRKEVAQSAQMDCGSITCPSKSVCDEVTPSCLIKDCFPISESVSHSVNGNMVSVGDRIVQQCKVGYVPASGTSANVMSQCGKDGKWLNNIKCEEELKTCPLDDNMRPSATSTAFFQVFEHGLWKDRPCPTGTVFVPLTCLCDWPTK